MTDLSLAQKYILSPAGLVNQDLDSILDKISKSGYESLTQKERDFLFKAGKNN